MVERGELRLAPASDKPAPPAKLGQVSDEEAFRREMASVRRLGWSDTPVRLPEVIPPKRGSSGDTGPAEPAELAELAEFVSGRGEMDPFAAGLGVAGVASDRAMRILERLKRGDFSVQAHLDLHGATPDEARPAVERFLRRCRHQRLMCVRIVHGRGRHSAEEPSALKREVTRWLSSRKLSKWVVAFASARWKDGGAGAIYVLLGQ